MTRQDRSHLLKRYEVTVRFYDPKSIIGSGQWTEVYEFQAEGIVHAVDQCVDFMADSTDEEWSISSVIRYD